MSAPGADGASAPEGSREGDDPQDRDRTLLVGAVPTDQPAASAHSVGAAAFPRAQLRGRYGLILLGSEVLDVADEWQRLIAHNCAAHLVPGGSLAVSSTTPEFATHLGACGFDQVRAHGTRTLWRRTSRRTIHDVTAEARERLQRLTAAELADAMTGPDPVVVVDTRVPRDRLRYGVIPGSVAVPRTVLEWRADPASGYSYDAIGSFEDRLVVVCNEGYSSSIAAAALQELGFVHATDLIGGMVAWIGDGFEVMPADADEPVTMLGPEAQLAR